ncbi:MAG: MgtC/SapB family protein [Patescibacteria group bacterium]
MTKKSMDFFQSQSWQMILQLLLAAFLGGIIGIEREAMRRAAGLKTYILVCMGCALFTIISYAGFKEFIGTTSFDPSRIAAGILTGIGFIGAGTILRREDKIEGVTTAAGLWITSAIGIAVGLKLYAVAIFTALFSLFILTIVRSVEHKIERKKE